MTDNPPLWRYWPPVAPEIALLVSIPHTGVFVPPAIVAQFTHASIASELMTDWALHELYTFLPALGVDVIHATHHRFVVDLNRPPDARPLYPGRFETGLVPTETFQGEPIWRQPPSAAEIAPADALSPSVSRRARAAAAGESHSLRALLPDRRAQRRIAGEPPARRTQGRHLPGRSRSCDVRSCIHAAGE
jgi:N-formylglutamate deformylase